MVGNDGMENIFERIGLKKFVGFSGQSKQKKKTVSGSGLEKDGKNDRALPVNNGQESQVFHLHGNC